MKKIVVLILFFLAIIFGVYAQAPTYPNMVITGTDTSINVSIKKVRSYNHAIADLEACNVLADTNYSQLLRYDIEKKKNSQLSHVNDSIEKYLAVQVKEKKLQDSICNKTKTDHEKKISWLKTQRNVLAGGVLVAIVYEIIKAILPKK